MNGDQCGAGLRGGARVAAAKKVSYAVPCRLLNAPAFYPPPSMPPFYRTNGGGSNLFRTKGVHRAGSVLRVATFSGSREASRDLYHVQYRSVYPCVRGIRRIFRGRGITLEPKNFLTRSRNC